MDTLAFGATVCSGRFNKITAYLREKPFMCQDSHVKDMNSPLLCHQCIKFQQDNGWYFEECKRLTQRSVYWFLFPQEYLKSCHVFSLLFLYISYPSPFEKKSPSLVFLNWMTQFTFDIYLSQIVRKCAHIPKILKHFSLPFLFYIYTVYKPYFVVKYKFGICVIYCY